MLKQFQIEQTICCVATYFFLTNKNRRLLYKHQRRKKPKKIKQEGLLTWIHQKLQSK